MITCRSCDHPMHVVITTSTDQYAPVGDILKIEPQCKFALDIRPKIEKTYVRYALECSYCGSRAYPLEKGMEVDEQREELTLPEFNPRNPSGFVKLEESEQVRQSWYQELEDEYLRQVGEAHWVAEMQGDGSMGMGPKQLAPPRTMKIQRRPDGD